MHNLQMVIPAVGRNRAKERADPSYKYMEFILIIAILPIIQLFTSIPVLFILIFIFFGLIEVKVSSNLIVSEVCIKGLGDASQGKDDNDGYSSCIAN